MMTYEEAWTFLDRLQFFKIKLGLASMARFLASVSNPQDGLPCIHVAGTNGKGSVATTLLAILSRAGYRTGLYTSPHLSSVRERFRIDDRFISEDEFAREASRIRDVLGTDQITYFEFTTALALLWFAREKVDVAILEVGMGGRLDATNVVTPLVGVITNVSMDHEQYLGNTLSAVAAEKAGIIKSGVPLVSGVAADESLEVVSRVCREQEAPLFLLGRDFRAEPMENGTWRYRGMGEKHRLLEGLQNGLAGEHQRQNAALALAALEVVEGQLPVSGEEIRAGLLSARWPGRLESFCLAAGRTVVCPEPGGAGSDLRRYLLDGAHNPAGVQSLRDALEKGFPRARLILVWASMADKDIANTLAPIADLAEVIIFTRPESERSAGAEQLRQALPEAKRASALAAATVAEALAEAARQAGSEDLICVAGSLYLVGAARNILVGGLA